MEKSAKSAKKVIHSLEEVFEVVGYQLMLEMVGRTNFDAGNNFFHLKSQGGRSLSTIYLLTS